MTRYKDILVIGDAHAHPDYDNKRFALAGKLAKQLKVDLVVDMGDWFDMPSLVAHNRGTVQAEGRRIQDDLHAGHDAADVFRRALGSHNPTLIQLGGNHEERLDRFAGNNPEIEGHVGIHLAHKDRWEFIPFLDYFECNGVYFTHYVANDMGRSISGKNLAERIVLENGVSTVVGHSHFYQATCRPANKPTGQHKVGVVAGLFGHPAYNERWCVGGRPHWWHGLIHLAGVRGGEFDPRPYSMSWLERNLK